MMMLMHMMWLLCMCFLQVMVIMNVMISHQMMPCCYLMSNITLHCLSDVLVYKYDASILLWCNVTVISSALVIVSEITLLESYTVHLPTIYSIIVWPFQTPYCMFFWMGEYVSHVIFLYDLSEEKCNGMQGLCDQLTRGVHLLLYIYI